MSIILYLQCALSPIGYGGLRYVAHFYALYILAIGLIMHSVDKNKKFKNAKRILVLFMIVISLANIFPYFNIIRKEFYLEKNSRWTLTEMAKIKKI